MATKESLEHDRMRVAVARRVEEALECPDGITSYFEGIPEDDEEPNGQDDGWEGLCWDNHSDPDDDEEDAVYRVAASAVFGLEKGITEDEGYLAVCASVREVFAKFERAVRQLEGPGQVSIHTPEAFGGRR